MALPPLLHLTPTSLKFSFPCALYQTPQGPYLLSQPPHDLTTLSQVCPIASQRQLPYPWGKALYSRAFSPDVNELSEGILASNPHWSSLTTSHEKTCSARCDNHLREVPSSPICRHTALPSTAISFTKLCTSSRTDGQIKPFSSILKATLIDGQVKLWDLILSVGMQFVIQEASLTVQVCVGLRGGVSGTPQAQGFPSLGSPTCGSHHCSHCSSQPLGLANRVLKKCMTNSESQG